MIGKRELTPDQAAFNLKWHAPYGRRDFTGWDVLHRAARRCHLRLLEAKILGPFGFQPDNNATRSFEYPWAALAVPVESGQTIVDLGGSLAGLQFVFAQQGAHVVNVDPSDEATMGWPINEDTFALLNKAFGTDVELRKQFLNDAGIPDGSVDRLYCISTIEHIPESQIPDLMREIRRILRPGGYAVLTIDLFYDLSPFTGRRSNLHGANINVAALVEASGMALVQGNTAELNGYPEFDPVAILADAQDHVQGDLAVNTAQALVLQR